MLVKALKSIKKNISRCILYKNYADLTSGGILWSKGYAQLCDFNGGKWHIVDSTERLLPKSSFRVFRRESFQSVWLKCGSHAINGQEDNVSRFVDHALPFINRPFRLFTSDGDSSTVDLIRNSKATHLLMSPHMVSWHATNAVEPSRLEGLFSMSVVSEYRKKVRPIPIGLDLHTDRNKGVGFSVLSKLKEVADAQLPRRNKILVDCCLQQNSKERSRLCSILAKIPEVTVLPERVPYHEILRLYAGHVGVLSLPGNGFDCHRTWECLFLGTPVVTSDVGLGWLYTNLPVFQVDHDSFENLDWANLIARLNGLLAQTNESSFARETTISPKRWIAD